MFFQQNLCIATVKDLQVISKKHHAFAIQFMLWGHIQPHNICAYWCCNYQKGWVYVLVLAEGVNEINLMSRTTTKSNTCIWSIGNCLDPVKILLDSMHSTYSILRCVEMPLTRHKIKFKKDGLLLLSPIFVLFFYQSWIQ